MRTIKFRIWDKEFKRFLQYEEYNNFNISPIDGHILYLDGHDCVDRLIPLQYTGLKDKNGKEIYEGDIIFQDAEGYRTTGIVKLSDDLRWCVGSHYINGSSFYNKFRKIIGNIYENPELLEKTE